MINHWCRVVMNNHVSEFIGKLPKEHTKALEISGTEWSEYGFGSYTSVQYPDFDICKNTLKETYDLIIVEQVFEHIERPDKAIKNIYKMLNKGGIILITTPFMIKYHPSPNDFWRWSKQGMRVFLTNAGFKNIKTYAWGNKECLIANLDNWPVYNKKHSLANDDDFPVVVWAYAYRANYNPMSIISKLK